MKSAFLVRVGLNGVQVIQLLTQNLVLELYAWRGEGGRNILAIMFGLPTFPGSRTTFFFLSIPALQVEGVDWTVSYVQEELSFPELESSHISVYLLRYTPHRLCVWAPRTNQTPKSAPLQPDTVG